MTQPFRIAVIGLGTVGVGVIKILTRHQSVIEKKAGRPIEIVAVSARSKDKDRGIDVQDYDWIDNPTDVGNHENIDAVIELIGGSEGTAKDLVEAALTNGKAVVSANKALIAHHGYELASLAEDNGAALLYEAAVAGGIPIIKSIREGFAANDIEAVYGILNGTCNYILTEMRETGRSFADVLKDAQELGFAEADPAFDIEGVDAAHKTSIISALSYGVKPNFKELKVNGITNITANDIKYADELGYRIKLLGVTRRVDDKIMQSVEPCLVPKNSELGNVEGVFNAVYVKGDFVDRGLAVGRGAGEGPTASAVVADIIDLARGNTVPAFGIPTSDLADADWADVGNSVSQFYLHLKVLDEHGVLADISAIMRDHNISMEVILQRGQDPGNPVSIVIISHNVKQADLVAALVKADALKSTVEPARYFRIEDI